MGNENTSKLNNFKFGFKTFKKKVRKTLRKENLGKIFILLVGLAMIISTVLPYIL